MHLNFNQWIAVSKLQFTRRQINRYASSFFRKDPMGVWRSGNSVMRRCSPMFCSGYGFFLIRTLKSWLVDCLLQVSRGWALSQKINGDHLAESGNEYLALEKQTRNCITYFSFTVVCLLRWNRVENLIFVSCEITERKIWFIIKSITGKDI